MINRVIFVREFVMVAMLFAAGVGMSGCQSSEGGFFFAPRATLGADRSSDLSATRLPVLTGPEKSLQDFKGSKGLLIVFVGTACPSAQTIVGGVDNASRVLTPHGVPTVLVTLDDAQRQVQEYFRSHAVKAPVLYDTTTATKERWKVTRVPTIVLLDSTGHEAYVGYGQWSPVARAAETMLGLSPGTVHIDAESTGLT